MRPDGAPYGVVTGAVFNAARGKEPTAAVLNDEVARWVKDVVENNDAKRRAPLYLLTGCPVRPVYRTIVRTRAVYVSTVLRHGRCSWRCDSLLFLLYNSNLLCKRRSDHHDDRPKSRLQEDYSSASTMIHPRACRNFRAGQQ